MILPYRLQNPPERLPVVTCTLILLNTVFFFATSNGLEIREEALAMGGLTGANPTPMHFLSSMFLHADLLHLLGNMFFLYIFGFAVEGKVGWWKYLILYLMAGFAGDVLHLLLVGLREPDIPSLGASGAIMGVLGAGLRMFPFAKVKVWYWFGLWFYGVWIWPMWGVGLYYLGYDLFLGMFSLSLGLNSGVGHFAHLGGALGGFLLALLLGGPMEKEEVSEAKATLDDTKDYGLLNKSELANIGRNMPDNHLAVHHWMHKSLESGRVDVDCQAAFRRSVPFLIKEGDAASVGASLLGLSRIGEDVEPHDLLTCGIAAEKAAQTQLAVEIFRAVRAHARASEGDLETATFRLALMYEQWFQNYQGAVDLHREFLSRWPMSPLEGSVRMQLGIAEKRLAAQGGTY